MFVLENLTPTHVQKVPRLAAQNVRTGLVVLVGFAGQQAPEVLDRLYQHRPLLVVHAGQGKDRLALVAHSVRLFLHHPVQLGRVAPTDAGTVLGEHLGIEPREFRVLRLLHNLLRPATRLVQVLVDQIAELLKVGLIVYGGGYGTTHGRRLLSFVLVASAVRRLRWL